MLNLVKTAPTVLPVWMVQLQVELAIGDRRSLNDDDLEPMVELLYRTQGVRSVAVVPVEGGLAVAVGLAAGDATAALERARGLTISCARYAGLGVVAVRRTRVTPAPDARTARGRTMHEMAIAKRLLAEAVERLDGHAADRVTDVEIVLGSAAHLSAESVRQHFELAARGTPAEGATLHFTLAPSRYWCFDCMFEFSSRAHGGGTCPRCGGSVLSLDREELAYVRSVGAGVR